MPLPRFRIRTLMIAVAIVAGSFCVREGSYVSRGVGRKSITLTFVVSDAERGAPVPNASISLRDPERPTATSPPEAVTLETDSEGRATVTLTMWVTDARTPSGRRLSFCVQYPQWEMRVEASGYAPYQAPFTDFERGNPLFYSGETLPPVPVRLKRL